MCGKYGGMGGVEARRGCTGREKKCTKSTNQSRRKNEDTTAPNRKRNKPKKKMQTGSVRDHMQCVEALRMWRAIERGTYEPAKKTSYCIGAGKTSSGATNDFLSPVGGRGGKREYSVGCMLRAEQLPVILHNAVLHNGTTSLGRRHVCLAVQAYGFLENGCESVLREC